jgi:hypothetical protein
MPVQTRARALTAKEMEAAEALLMMKRGGCNEARSERPRRTCTVKAVTVAPLPVSTADRPRRATANYSAGSLVEEKVQPKRR